MIILTKHEEIIRHIKSLKIGAKISVRSIAGELKVSEGTAYRAIKDAENMGLANTIPRVGTIRIEKLEKKNIEKLTFAEVVNIIEGSVLGGSEGLSMILNNFVIGAMTMESMKKYIAPGNLFIVGDREEAQECALSSGCAVLITGGFKCSDYIRDLANEKRLPVISCTYDTFTTATMLNNTISENLIKKDIILVEDIMKTDVVYLKSRDTIGALRNVVKKTRHGIFPVLDENEKLCGMIDFKDISFELSDKELISKVMVREIISLSPQTSVAYAAHIMTWESLELIPVTEGKKLVGVVSHYDVIKALQHLNKQPHFVETLDDLVLKNFACFNIENGITFNGRIAPQMLNNMGTASWSTLSLIMSTAGINILRRRNHLNVEVDSFTVFYAKPIQLDMVVSVNVRIIDMGKTLSKVEIELIKDENNELVGKALLSARVIRK
jgi:predicted transcriptional regulator